MPSARPGVPRVRGAETCFVTTAMLSINPRAVLTIRPTLTAARAVVIIALLLADCHPVLAGIYNNKGFALLLEALSSRVVHSDDLERAALSFRHAAVLDSSNRSSYRGLGWALSASDKGESAAAWRAGGFTAESFIQRGSQEYLAGHYDQSMVWYQSAATIQPDLGDPWYHIGQVHEETQEWEQALRAYRRAASLPSAQLGQSDAYYAMGKLLLDRGQPLDLAAALSALGTAIAQNDFSQRRWAADSHYQRGEVYRLQGLDAEASLEYQWAIDSGSDCYWACIRLGNLLLDTRQNTSQAEVLFQRAADANSSRPQAYLGLGRLYRTTDRTLRAVEMYRLVLELDPGNETARDQLEQLLPSGDR